MGEAVDGGTIEVGDKSFSWIRQGALDGRPTVLLAHGAGAPYRHPFMERTADGLEERGCTVVRFHFPYMEVQVETGKRRPPNAARILLDSWAAMLTTVRAWKRVGPIVLAGKSMGGRMASMLLADGRGEGASGAVYLGYPLHPPGKSDQLRKDHLAEVPRPQLFVSGTRDNLAKFELLEPLVAGLENATLHRVDGGDHSLAKSRKAPFEGMGEWLDATAGFVRRVTGG